MATLDEIDRQILQLLTENSKLSTRKIAKKTLIPITTVYTRIKKLEQEGVIEGYTLRVNKKKIGQLVTAYSFIEFDGNKLQEKKLSYEQFDALIKKYLTFHLEDFSYISGSKDILLKLNAESIEAVNELLEKIRWHVPGVIKSETVFVLENIRC